MERADAREWSRLRTANQDWLAPWEPSAGNAWPDRHSTAAYRAMRRSALRRARAGVSLPFALRFGRTGVAFGVVRARCNPATPNGSTGTEKRPCTGASPPWPKAPFSCSGRAGRNERL